MQKAMLFGVALAVLGLLSAAAHAAPGDLDPSFGTGGVVSTDLGGEDIVRDVAVDSAGRVIVVGDNELSATKQEAIVVRYTADGSLDPAFGGGDGIVRFHFGAGLWDDAASVAIDGGDRVVVAGSMQSDPACSGSCVFAAARLTSSGQLDPSFAGDGTATTAVCCGAAAVAVDGSGRIVVGGYAATVRLTESGVLDPTFDGDGVSHEGSGAYGLALDGAGRIVEVSNSSVASRLLTTGQLDPSFDGDGQAIIEVAPGGTAFSNAMAVDGSDRVLAAGTATLSGETAGRLFVMRLTASGAPDSTFGGGDGIVLGDPHSWANDIAVDDAGRALVVGQWPSLDALGDVLVRLLPNGSLDPAFGGGDGAAAVPFLLGRDVTTDSAQRIVVGGSAFREDEADLDFAAARYLDEGGPSSPPSPLPPPSPPTPIPAGSAPVVAPESGPQPGCGQAQKRVARLSRQLKQASARRQRSRLRSQLRQARARINRLC